eukprot:scaffold31923_cov112-Isochrysis_galbana.AAC.2
MFQLHTHAPYASTSRPRSCRRTAHLDRNSNATAPRLHLTPTLLTAHAGWRRRRRCVRRAADPAHGAQQAQEGGGQAARLHHRGDEGHGRGQPVRRAARR